MFGNKHLLFFGIIEIVSLCFFRIPHKFTLRRSYFDLIGFCTFHINSATQILKCNKLDFLPFYISYYVLSMDLDGTLLRMKATISCAYPQKKIKWSELLIMDWTMSNKVQFLLSETPLCCGVPGGIDCERIPFFFR